MIQETVFLPDSDFLSGSPFSAVTVGEAIQDTLNREGKNRRVKELRYLDISKRFPYFTKFQSKFVGAICESRLFESTEDLESNPYIWVENIDQRTIVHRIRAFVVLTLPTIQSRNIYVAQSLFPFLFSQLTTTENSPCKVLSSMPIYLLCMASEDVAIPESVRRDLDFVSAAGIMVLAPMRKGSVVSNKPLTIERMNDLQSSMGLFTLDEAACTFRIEQSGLESLIDQDGRIKGSKEKFGMLSLIPAALVARRTGYRLCLSGYDAWLSRIKVNGTGVKIRNLENVQKFLKKINN